ncbi:MAG: ParB N-terminal domain-containing protein [Bacteroidales bacterium]|nr:ParB N-terminal domain-containing protein [Bacteroidales bacterium]
MFEIREIKIRDLRPNNGDVEGLPRNPRKISNKQLEKLKKSLKDAPEMLRLRELIVVHHGGKFVVIAGNQRLEAAKAVGMETLPCKVLPADTAPAKLREYAIKDNLPFGEDDWEVIASDWDTAELEEWGMSVPSEWKVRPDDFGEDFTLPDGEKGFATMTFTLSNEQQRIIEEAIKYAKQMEEYKYVETFGNTNTNGNALYLILTQWADARK